MIHERSSIGNHATSRVIGPSVHHLSAVLVPRALEAIPTVIDRPRQYSRGSAAWTTSPTPPSGIAVHAYA